MRTLGFKQRSRHFMSAKPRTQNYRQRPTLKQLHARPVKDLTELDCKRLLADISTHIPKERLEAIRYKVAMDKTVWSEEQVDAICKSIAEGI